MDPCPLSKEFNTPGGKFVNSALPRNRSGSNFII